MHERESGRLHLLYVSDLDTAVEFYRDTLGLTLEYQYVDIGWADFGAPPTTIALAVDDVEAVLDELRDGGHEVEMEYVGTGVCDMAMVTDPDGNPVMLHRRHDGTRGRKTSFEADE